MIVCDRCGKEAGFRVDRVAVHLYGNTPEEHRLWEKPVDLCGNCFDRLKKIVIDHLAEPLPIAVKR